MDQLYKGYFINSFISERKCTHPSSRPVPMQLFLRKNGSYQIWNNKPLWSP